MTDATDYVPPKVWTWTKPSGGRFANINRPIAGPTHDKELPVGRHPLQLYSLGTPNGVKVTIMLEELLALGRSGAEYEDENEHREKRVCRCNRIGNYGLLHGVQQRIEQVERHHHEDARLRIRPL